MRLVGAKSLSFERVDIPLVIGTSDAKNIAYRGRDNPYLQG